MYKSDPNSAHVYFYFMDAILNTQIECFFIYKLDSFGSWQLEEWYKNTGLTSGQSIN